MEVHMFQLKHLKVRKKLWLIIGSALAGIVILSVMSLLFLEEQLKNEKALKTRHLVEVAYGILEANYGMVKEGKMTEEAAKVDAIATIKKLRYQEKEYFW